MSCTGLIRVTVRSTTGPRNLRGDRTMQAMSPSDDEKCCAILVNGLSDVPWRVSLNTREGRGRFGAPGVQLARNAMTPPAMK